MASSLHYDSLADLPPRMRQQVVGKITAKISPSPVAAMPDKKAKYHNVKVEANGITFDSKKEARRYLTLLDALREGVISDLRLQQDFTLQEAYTTPDGERIRAIRYRADFTYKVEAMRNYIPATVSFDDMEYWRSMIQQRGAGVEVIEDVKSTATRTAEYKMKRKMMVQKGYIIREV